MADFDSLDRPVLDKPVWKRPMLHELGSLRDFVRASSPPAQAGGKSGAAGDGVNEDGAPESMN